MEGFEETVFWLFTQVVEHILPIGYYNHLVEPQALVDLTMWLFSKIDPVNAEILGDVPGMVFPRHFMNLFTELRNPGVSGLVIIICSW